MATTMTVQCPSCDTAFPVDPQKVPEGGVRTQCTVCETFFRVDRPDAGSVSAPAPGAAAVPEDTAWDTGAEETAWEVPAEEAVEAPSGETQWDAASSETGWDASSEGIDEVSGLEPVGAFGAEELDSADTELPVLEGTEVYEEPDQPDVALKEALEPEVEEVEPLEAMEAGDVEDGILEPTGTSEVGAGDDWSGELGDDWVLETDDVPTFEETDVEVERLDTVEEQMRSIQDQER
ncbi:MAG TPA: zinc-ribbon domain-containing protein, partial [Longimicrobiales bacterium]|nr:zinc-ribbon domain-containing protein [Longimicrobiales bacterium]